MISKYTSNVIIVYIYIVWRQQWYLKTYMALSLITNYIGIG